MSQAIPADLQAMFFAIADVLIPEAEGMPCASQVGGVDEILDRILAIRRDLNDHFLRGLQTAVGKNPAEAAQELQKTDPAAYGAIGVVASAGYYMSPRVRELIGYPGQEKRTYDPDATPEYIANGMLQAVIDRGSIYRPTPK